MKKVIYTIGYTGFQIQDFISALKQRGINVVIDVRSFAYSERYPDYNKPQIERVLNANFIYYRNYVNEFGARQSDHKYYSKYGYLDFEAFSKSDQFQAGVKKIINSIDKGFKIAFMCAEKDPTQCHRAIMVARYFSDIGFDVCHIMPEGEKSQKDIEKELLKKFFPDYNPNQIGMFVKSMEECVCEAYRSQNEKIGYTEEQGEQ